MSTHPYIPLYVDDYDAATAHLTVEEDGAYSRLLRLCWRTPGCSLPNDHAWIARKIRLCVEDYDRIAKPVIDEFFRLSRGRLVQKRLREEYDDISRKKLARKIAGKKGGDAKALKSKENLSSNASQLPPDTCAFQNQNQNHIDINPPTPQEGGQGDDLFGEKPIDEETSSRRKPKRAIPADCPTADQIEAAQAEARKAGADVDMAYQAQRFRNWALAKDARYADWSRTWVNWSIKAIADAPKRPSLVATNSAAPSADDIAARWDRRVADYRKAWTWNEVDWGPKPGREGCKAPAWILEKHGYAPKTGDAA